MLYVSTSWIKDNNFFDGIRFLSKITPNIELSGGSKYREDLFDNLKCLKEMLKLNYLVHGYFPPSEDSKFLLNLSDNNSYTRSFISKSMEYVYEFNIPYYSMHAGFKHSYSVKGNSLYMPKGVFKFEDMLDNINWFKQAYKNKKLAIENLYPIGRDIECGFCIDLKEITKLMEIEDSLYLLLDLGHLKVSSAYLGFNFIETAEILIRKYENRILEIHLSENNGKDDDHFHIMENSEQYEIISRNIDRIKKYNINLVIESRNSSFKELGESFLLINNLF